MSSLLLILFGLCCVEIQYCYDFTTTGQVNLVDDNGWSELCSVCVGYTEVNTSTSLYPPAGHVNVTLITHNNVDNNTEYIIAFYIKPPSSELSCEEKLNHNPTLLVHAQLSAQSIWTQTIMIFGEQAQHKQDNWYIYLVQCDMNAYPLISYQIDYCDANDAKDTCSHFVFSAKLIRLIIGIVLALIIVGVLLFTYYVKRKQERNENENVLMQSFSINNEVNTLTNDENELHNLLISWSLDKYSKTIIDEKGYNCIAQWKQLTIDDLKEMGLTQQESEQFVHQVQQFSNEPQQQ